jgi:O-antigen/teichoic acid export membrane protein
MSFLNLLSVIADKIDSIIIFSFLGPVNLAVYAFAALLPEQIKTFAKLLIPLYMPKLAERSIYDIRLALRHRLLQLLALGAVVVILYILAAPLLFTILFPIYIESVPFTQLYAVATLVTLVWIPFTAIFQSHRRTKELYIMNNVSSVFLLIALPILTYQFGIGGAILSEILYRLLGAIVAIYLFFRIPVSSR